MFKGLGPRVWDLGFRGLGFGVYGYWLRLWGLGTCCGGSLQNRWYTHI